jgi:hypothetical protein
MEFNGAVTADVPLIEEGMIFDEEDVDGLANGFDLEVGWVLCLFFECNIDILSYF